MAFMSPKAQHTPLHTHFHSYMFTADKKEMPVASISQLDFITNEPVTANDEIHSIKSNRN